MYKKKTHKKKNQIQKYNDILKNYNFILVRVKNLNATQLNLLKKELKLYNYDITFCLKKVSLKSLQKKNADLKILFHNNYYLIYTKMDLITDDFLKLKNILEILKKFQNNLHILGFKFQKISKIFSIDYILKIINQSSISLLHQNIYTQILNLMFFFCVIFTKKNINE